LCTQVAPLGVLLPQGAETLPLPLFIAVTHLFAAQASDDAKLDKYRRSFMHCHACAVTRI
jgi:hypothetical protein